MIVATAGHVDHGKTSLVRALTGVDTDRLAEEKRRGLTIDLGFAYLPAPGGETIGFVDVPGHQRFVHTMLAGVAGVDAALLVIAADDGPMPQTAEHLAILNLLGINRGVCVISKCDAVDADRRREVAAQVTALVQGTGLSDAPLFEVSSATGAGIDTLKDHLQAMASDHARVHRPGPFRFAIDRAFTVVGSGLVVTGTALAGVVAPGDKLVVAPGGQAVRVRGLHAGNAALNEGRAGQRLGINIAGPDAGTDTVRRGDWLVDPARAATALRLDIALTVLPTEAKPFGPRGHVHLHIGAADVPARVQVLDGTAIPPGGQGLVHLTLQRPVSAVVGDRLILRDRAAARTVGGGVVLDPDAAARRLRAPARQARLLALKAADPAAALIAVLRTDDGVVLLDPFARAWNIHVADAAVMVDGAGAVTLGAGPAAAALLPATRDSMAAALIDHLAAWHKQHPTAAGIEVGALQRATNAALPPAAFQDLLHYLQDAGQVRRRGPLVAAHGHAAQMPRAEAALWARIRPLLAAGGTQPPRVAELADALGAPPADIRRALDAAARLGLAHPVAANRAYLARGLRPLADAAAALAAEAPDGRFDVAAFRDTCQLGRNLAIEVLEYFDRLGLTRRDGNARQIAGDPAALFPPDGDDVDTALDAG